MVRTRKKPRREVEKNHKEQSPEHPQLNRIISETRRLAHGLDHPVNNGRALSRRGWVFGEGNWVLGCVQVDLFSVGFGSGGIEDDDLGAGDDVEVDGDKSISGIAISDVQVGKKTSERQREREGERKNH
jgi:hypothetical protein